jgi:hypothetical protein
MVDGTPVAQEHAIPRQSDVIVRPHPDVGSRTGLQGELDARRAPDAGADVYPARRQWLAARGSNHE